MGCQLGDATTPARSATWGAGARRAGWRVFSVPSGGTQRNSALEVTTEAGRGGRGEPANPPRAARGVRARPPGPDARAVARSRGRAVERSRASAGPARRRNDRSHGGFFRRCGVRRRIPVQHAPPPTVSRRPPPRGSRPCRRRRRARWKPCARTSVSRARAEARVARRPTVPRAVGHGDEIANAPRARVFPLELFPRRAPSGGGTSRSRASAEARRACRRGE